VVLEGASSAAMGGAGDAPGSDAESGDAGEFVTRRDARAALRSAGVAVAPHAERGRARTQAQTVKRDIGAT
jgi:hypothetical protein